MSFVGHVLNFFLPPQCLHCRTEVKDAHQLCPDCWGKLSFLTHPLCRVCGIPFPFEAQEGALACASCVRHPPLFTKARSTFAYDEGIKPLILGLKHGDSLDFAPLLANFLYQTAKQHDLLAHVDAVVPVPLHWSRLVYRQYNQAAVLAKILARNAGISYAPTLLKRCRATPPQGHLSLKERALNVQHSFSVPPHQQRNVKDRCVLLIDDVLTSGSTLTECARTLLNSGVAEVRVLTLARVITRL